MDLLSAFKSSIQVAKYPRASDHRRGEIPQKECSTKLCNQVFRGVIARAKAVLQISIKATLCRPVAQLVERHIVELICTL